jgi:hypothetical protein
MAKCSPKSIGLWDSPAPTKQKYPSPRFWKPSKRRGFLPITGSPQDHKNCKLPWANKIKGMTLIGFELIEKVVFLPLMESSTNLLSPCSIL